MYNVSVAKRFINNVKGYFNVTKKETNDNGIYGLNYFKRNFFQ